MGYDLLTEALEKLKATTPAPGAWMHHGDALKMLRALPAGSVDLLFADPPYFLSNGGTTVQNGERVSVDKGTWDESQGVRVDRDFQRAWLRAAQRALRSTGTMFVSGTYHCILAIGWSMLEQGWNILNLITWQKPNPPPNLACRVFTHSTEQILWAAPEAYEPLKHVFNYAALKAANDDKQLKDVWTMTAPGAAEKTHGKHPTQKPLALLERIVSAATNPNALVVDPFAGSATTGVAALRLGRRFIGSELDPEHFALASRRLSNAKDLILPP